MGIQLKSRGNRVARMRGRRLRFESLEERRVLATFMVTNLDDAPVAGAGHAPGTLRQAIFDAAQSPGADVIQFSAGLSGTIELFNVADIAQGPSALVIDSDITIRGNGNSLTIGRAAAGPEMRIFRVTASGSLTLESMMVTGGMMRGVAATVSGMSGGLARGGAVYNQGSLTVLSSTIYGNMAIGGIGINALGGSAHGGAIANIGGTVNIRNSTISSNSTVPGFGVGAVYDYGGGVYTYNGSVSVYNSTITSNVSYTGRGLYAITEAGSATIIVHSSIIGQSDTPATNRDAVALEDTGGQLFVSGANNIIRTEIGFDAVGFSNLDPLLGVLANYGGPTLTHEISVASPAVDSGSNLMNFTVDQRGAGHARVRGTGVDIGAFEVQGTTELLAGDYNRNGVVEASDYVLWRKTMGASVTAYDAADGDGSGKVDVGDYGVWWQNFGSVETSGTGGESVFEALGWEKAPAFVEAVGSPVPIVESRTSLRDDDELLFEMAGLVLTPNDVRGFDDYLAALLAHDRLACNGRSQVWLGELE